LVKRLTILGKHWRFVRRRLREYHGFVNGVGPDNPASSTDLTRREIVVDASLRGESELRFILHEFLHAADWHKSEEWVDQVSSDAARFLTRLGYRKDIKPTLTSQVAPLGDQFHKRRSRAKADIRPSEVGRLGNARATR
jgi:hypothetical protein